MNDADKSKAEYWGGGYVLGLAECTTAGLVLETHGYHRDKQ